MQRRLKKEKKVFLLAKHVLTILIIVSNLQTNGCFWSQLQTVELLTLPRKKGEIKEQLLNSLIDNVESKILDQMEDKAEKSEDCAAIIREN